MAKDQYLSLNPGKLSGVCGRLMCCLAYETDFYQDVSRIFPEIGAPVICDKGKGIVSKVDPFKNQIYVQLEQGLEMKFSIEEFQNLRKP
jgi:cell fate regulator YaaT (PSP1 superfamily)